jgi:hypothetical protein
MLVAGGSNPGVQVQSEGIIRIVFNAVKLQIEGRGAGKTEVNKGITAAA